MESAFKIWATIVISESNALPIDLATAMQLFKPYMFDVPVVCSLFEVHTSTIQSSRQACFSPAVQASIPLGSVFGAAVLAKFCLIRIQKLNQNLSEDTGKIKGKHRG